ncbi:MAG: hypothetical protein KI785_15815 [Devosiaceae bacterium]|nr:hypothetical protein [Devosiaceae bacterium MH13]
MIDTTKLIAVVVLLALLGGAFLMVDRRAYQRGAMETAQRLHTATIEAAEDLTDAAEARRLVRRQCIAAGGVPELATGECQLGAAGSDQP